MRKQLTMTRGDTRTFTVTVTNDAGAPLDLTSASLDFTVCDLFDKSLGDGIAVDTPATGVAVITVDPADTEDSGDRRRSYPYDLQVTLADGSIKTPLSGRFVVIPDVTTED